MIKNILIFLFLLQGLCLCNVIVLPFNTTNIQKNIKQDDYFSKIFSNELYSQLSIGTPKRSVKAIIKMAKISFGFFEDSYPYESSSSFSKTNSLKVFYHMNYITGYISKDKFTLYSFKTYEDFLKSQGQNLNNYCIDTDLEFTLAKKIDKEEEKEIVDTDIAKNTLFYGYGILGLQEEISEQNPPPIFIESLKSSKLINQTIFTFVYNEANHYMGEYYDTETNGYILIGEDLVSKKEMDSIKWVNSNPIQGKNYWNVDFNEVYIDEGYDKKNREIHNAFQIRHAEILGNIPFIYAENEYRIFIYSQFFAHLVHRQICFYRNVTINPEYATYVCDSTSEEFQIYYKSKFPDLHFTLDYFETTFTLTKNDLFTYNKEDKSDKNIYFLVVFQQSREYHNPEAPILVHNPRWKLGIPFLKKYKFFFDMGQRLIGYSPEIKINNENIHKNLATNSIHFMKLGTFFIIIVLSFFAGVLFLKKTIKINKRKKRINELKEENSKEIDESNDVNSENSKQLNLI